MRSRSSIEQEAMPGSQHWQSQDRGSSNQAGPDGQLQRQRVHHPGGGQTLKQRATASRKESYLRCLILLRIRRFFRPTLRRPLLFFIRLTVLFGSGAIKR
jgi:hypothetical protein